jgi:mono/diheme cytochrome c family protein
LKRSFVLVFVFAFPAALLLGMKSNSSQKKFQQETDLQKSIAAGKKVFKKYCISCHQADGGGVPNLNPPLINTPYIIGNKENLIKIILNGLNKNIEIEDEVFSNPMPALKVLKDQEIADVLTYVRNSFGNKASMITTAEVKTVRTSVK